MVKKYLENEKIFVAGAMEWLGNAICRALFKKWLWESTMEGIS